MIFANGTSGTIGSHLGDGVISLNNDLANQGQEIELSNHALNDWKLIHLAGVVGTGLVDSDLNHSRRINVEATASLGEFALKHEVNRFIYVSSSHVYEKSEGNLSESSPCNPVSNYAKQKLEAEARLQQIFAGSPERLCIVRVFSILGWKMPGFTLGGAVERVINDPEHEILKESLSERDFLTPKSIAQVLLQITKEDRSQGIINLCTGIATSVMDATLAMALIRGVILTPSNFEMTKSSNPRIVGDSSKLKKLIPDLDLRWEPELAI
jgi:nucleoside-diphosphate-sugar epimerase